MAGRMTSHRAAPSAVRTAISRCRWTPRASNSAATFVAAMSNTMHTAPNSNSNGSRTVPALSATNGATRRFSSLSCGYCATSRANSERNSVCADAGVAPSVRRASIRR